MSVVLIGDVGSIDGYHVGDEAMLEVAIDELRARGATDLTVISGDPADTRARYDVAAIAPIGFPSGAAADDSVRDRWLAAVRAIGDRRAAPDDDGGFALDDGPTRAGRIVAAIAASDGVVVAGGGNLSSSWPELLYERIAVLTVADILGIPSVVTGQTIGPALTARQHELLADALGTARLVGLRERSSFALASTMLPVTTPRRLQLDDATFLGSAGTDGPHGAAPVAGDYVALTLNPLGDDRSADDLVAAFATLVQQVHATTGLPVRFLPHVGPIAGDRISPTSDAGIAARLLERLGPDAGFEVIPMLDARSLATLTRGAAAIVSTRYHPLVFGLSGAVPGLGITQDRYTAVKLGGVLEHAGLAGWTVPIEAVTTGLAADLFEELWMRRDEVAKHIDALLPDWRADHARHWDEVALALSRPPTSLPVSGPDDEGPPPLDPHLAGLGGVNAVADRLRVRADDVERRSTDSAAEAEQYARSLEMTLAARATEIRNLHLARAALEAEIIQLRDDTIHAERAASGARRLAVQAREQLDAAVAAQAAATLGLEQATADAERRREQLEQLLATKTMRWTAGARRQWHRVRRGLLRRSG